MKRKVLVSLLVIAVVAGLVGASTFALFSDEEKSTGNTVQAGTLDLELEVGDPVNGSFSLTGIAPSQDLAPITLKFTNVGNIWGWVNMKLEFAEADDTTYVGDFSGAGWQMTDAEFAKLLYVKKFMWFDTAYPDYPEGWDNTLERDDFYDTNNDGLISLWEMQESALRIKTATGDCIFSMPKKTVTWVITFHMAHAFVDPGNISAAFTGSMAVYPAGGDYDIYQGAPVVWNVPQADGVKVDVTVYLDQRVPQP